MTKSLLLVTNKAGFTGKMQQDIEQTGRRLFVAKRKSEAIIVTDEENCHLAFLDLDIGERSARSTRPSD